jgi:glycosyltransferase involved in cell wall biosynthesis
MTGVDEIRPRRVHALIDSLSCGGAEILLAELAAAAPGAGIQLTVGFLDDRDGSPAARRLREAGVDPQLVGVGRLLSARGFLAVRQQLERVSPEVVHTHLGHADCLGGLAARSLGLPVVSTVHAMTWNGSARERARHALSFAVRRLAARRVIVVSETARRAYLARSSIDSSRVILVRNGVGGRRRPGMGRRVRRELGIDPTAPLVALTAPLRLEKGHYLAFAALALLSQSFPDLRVLLLGGGAHARVITQQAGALGGRVTVTGHRDDVIDVLDAVDVVVHTPRTDALPTTLIEAAAAGVPVVATAVGGIPEIVIDGRTGVLLAPDAPATAIATALASVLASHEVRARLGLGARLRFEHRFGVEHWAANLRAVYDEVVERERR